MNARSLAIFAAAVCCFGAVAGSAPPLHASPAAPHHAVCGGPIAPGEISPPPTIEMGAQPRNDLGVPELILRVRHDGERYCYRYMYHGTTQARAPIMVVHPGERFSVRIVNELSGPAKGATMTAGALRRCMPASRMQMSAPHEYVGYLNHPLMAMYLLKIAPDVNIHFHGFIGDPEEENIFLSTLSTPAHACEHTLDVPRDQPPGTYFYHRHAHGLAGDEVAGGLTGMWIVEPATLDLPVADDHAIELRYRVPFVKMYNFLPDATPLYVAATAHEAALKAAPRVKYDPFAPPPWPSMIPLRAGAVQQPFPCGNRPTAMLAVNGVDEPAVLTVPANEPQLLRFLNAASDSNLYLRAHDASGVDQPLHIVGRDGSPVGGTNAHPLAEYLSRTEQLIQPSQRVDMTLTLAPGQVLTFYGHSHCNAPADELQTPEEELVVRAGSPVASPTVLAQTAIEPSVDGAATLAHYMQTHRALVHRRAFTYTEYVLPRGKHGGYADYILTETSNPDFMEAPFMPRYAHGSNVPEPNVVVKRGTVEEWYLYNATMETHSFHIHQMSFVAENLDGGPQRVDTVPIPFGRLLPNPKDPNYPLIAPSVTRVILDFRNVPRGTFVYHCHMLFHEDRGMMGVIKVI